MGTKLCSFSNTVRPNFCTEKRSPTAEITPRLQGPLAAAIGAVVNDFAFVTAFLTGLVVACVAGADGAGGDWAHPAAARHDTKAAATTLRNIGFQTKVDEIEGAT